MLKRYCADCKATKDGSSNKKNGGQNVRLTQNKSLDFYFC